MPQGINGTGPNFYNAVNNIEKTAYTQANNTPVNFNGAAEATADTYHFSSSAKAAKEDDGKWGLLKTGLVLISTIAAIKTGKGLKLKGKNIKEIAKTIFNKDTLKAFGENMKAWKWFGGKTQIADDFGNAVKVAKKTHIVDDFGNLIKV